MQVHLFHLLQGIPLQQKHNDFNIEINRNDSLMSITSYFFMPIDEKVF